MLVIVGASGVLNAWVRIPSVGDLVTTAYGAMVLAKVAALVTLGAFGRAHRRRSLGGLDAGRPGAFRRLAAGEVVVMGSRWPSAWRSAVPHRRSRSTNCR